MTSIAGCIHAQYPGIIIIRTIDRFTTIEAAEIHAMLLPTTKSLDATVTTCPLLWVLFNG
jgi:hypothetical protein